MGTSFPKVNLILISHSKESSYKVSSCMVGGVQVWSGRNNLQNQFDVHFAQLIA